MYPIQNWQLLTFICFKYIFIKRQKEVVDEVEDFFCSPSLILFLSSFPYTAWNVVGSIPICCILLHIYAIS